jgi:hypothetical protein
VSSTKQERTFTKAYVATATVGRRVDLNVEVGSGWRTTRTKVLDSAMTLADSSPTLRPTRPK